MQTKEGFIYIAFQKVLLPGDGHQHCVVEKALSPQLF